MPRVDSANPARRALLRGLGVLLACLGLASTTLAAAHGAASASKDPGVAVVAAAEQHLKDTYAWGATGPHSWDCSGLTSTLWKAVGGVRAIPRVSRDQQAWAVPLPAEQVLPGDLVFFGAPVTHVGLVRGRTTTGTRTVVHMIDASSSQKGVVERDVWTSGTVRFGRVPRPGMTPVLPWKAPVVAPTPVVTPTPAVTAPDPTAALGARAVLVARSYLGSSTIGDVALVQTAWRRAGGAVLPSDITALPRGAREVSLRNARPGDVVTYGPPATHVGVYAGNGMMVDASRALGKVVERKVWASTALHVYRLGA